MTFAEKLRAMMKGRRLSQDAVAGRLGVSQGLVSRWCRGANTPDVFQGRALADVLDVGLDFLLDEDAPIERAGVESKLRGLIAEIGPEEAWRRLVGAPPATISPPGAPAFVPVRVVNLGPPPSDLATAPVPASSAHDPDRND